MLQGKLNNKPLSILLSNSIPVSIVLYPYPPPRNFFIILNFFSRKCSRLIIIEPLLLLQILLKVHLRTGSYIIIATALLSYYEGEEIIHIKREFYSSEEPHSHTSKFWIICDDDDGSSRAFTKSSAFAVWYFFLSQHYWRLSDSSVFGYQRSLQHQSN